MTKNKGGRPKGRKTGLPVIADDKYAAEFVRKKSETPGNLTPIAQADRSYLMAMFNGFKESLEPTIFNGDVSVTNPFKYTPRQMFDNVMKYMEFTLQSGQPLTISAICAFNRIDRNDLIPEGLAKLPKEYGFLTDCIRFIETYMEFTGQKKQNPAFQIFWLKNRGWKDKFEISASDIQGALTDTERDAAQQRVARFSEVKFVEDKLEKKLTEGVSI